MKSDIKINLDELIYFSNISSAEKNYYQRSGDKIMDEKFTIFNIFTMLGGLAFFLYGMNVMSTGLEKLTGGKLEAALQKMTSNKIKAILLGMGVTVAIQSSSAMTVMLVGFVNSGLMSLEQTIAVCFGSNIGTTFTAWILCLGDIDDGGSGGAVKFALNMLKLESFSPLVALFGVILIMFAKKNKKKDKIGRASCRERV